MILQLCSGEPAGPCWLPNGPPGAGGRPRLRHLRVGGQTLDLLHRSRSQAQAVTHITRLRLDAAPCEPAVPRRTGQNGRSPPKGQRLPTPNSPIAHPGLSGAAAPVDYYDGHHPNGGTHHAHRSVVSRGQAARAPAPGTGLGPPRGIRHTGPALYRPSDGPYPDTGMVCPAPATGGHPSGGAGSPGGGDPKPVSGPSHCPYNANPHGAPILDHPGGSPAGATATLGPSHSTWYAKPSPTFVDAMALVRRHLWLASEGFHCPPPTLIYGEFRSPCTAG